MVEPLTRLTLDTPAGLVRAEATVENGKVTQVKIKNVPAFLYRQDVMVEVPGFGPLLLDLAYGGNFYAILPAEAVGLSLEPRLAPALVEAGMRIMAAVPRQVPIEHPVNPGINELKHVLFTGPAQAAGADAKNAVIIYPGTVDRSPCGTGTSARLAQLYGRGQLSLGQPFVHESLIGTTFTGELVEEVELTPRVRAVVPTIAGRAWITGFNQLVLDPTDPFPAGFLLNQAV
jgi:proline racemase